MITYLERQKEQDKCPKYCVRSHCIGCSIYEKQKEQKPILEVFGFKVGDAVRLKDGDGRKHIIKSFEEVKGLHEPNFYHVEFEDNSARDGIYPGKQYPNGYYTQMEKFEEEQNPEKKHVVTKDFTSTDAIESCMLRYLQSAANRKDDIEIIEDTKKYKKQLLEIVKQKEQKPSIFPPGFGEVRWNPISSVQQKPSEWSEEDERKYQCIRSILLIDIDKKVGSRKYSEILEWYENRGIGRYTNSQPHWKPSEEQITAVEAAYSVLNSHDTWGEDEHLPILMSLINDL